MKSKGILNIELIRAVASVEHTQTMLVVDAGFPLPPGVPLIDLSLVRGIPTMEQVLQALSQEFVIESYQYAVEAVEKSPHMLGQYKTALPHIPGTAITHALLKEKAGSAAVVVRTGECTPFSNVILTGGVNF